MKYGRVYVIKDVITDEEYIGSTFKKINHRFNQHKAECKRKFRLGTPASSCYNMILRKKCFIKLLWSGYVFDEKHLKKMERKFIEASDNVVNKRKPILYQNEKHFCNQCLHCNKIN